MSQPLEFGVCDEGRSVYQLLTWCEGEEAKELLPRLTEKEQYAYGNDAAEILKKMEQVERKAPSLAWQECYRKRVEGYIQSYRECGYRFDGDEVVIAYLQNNLDCIGERPSALMHTDFQTDNMVISPDGELAIIDFQMCGEADPYLVLSGAGVSAMYSVPFAMGQMDGYFGKFVPGDFWDKYTYYMRAEMLYTFTVGVKMESERDETLRMFDEEVESIRQSQPGIPPWYGHGYDHRKKLPRQSNPWLNLM
jgi:serine/threonine-protein kinase